MAWYTQDANQNWWQLTIDVNGALVTQQVSTPGGPTGFYALQSLTGQQLVKIVQSKLGGYGNAVSPQTILMHLNEAKDEVWAVMKSLNDQNFVLFTQSSDAGLMNYFGKVVPGTREYNLPSDLKEVKFIEVISPTDQADVRFSYRKMTHPDWAATRRAANMDSTTNPINEYVYSIVGSNPQTFALANYPALTYDLRIWYVRGLADFTLVSGPSEIVPPYDRKITDFAVKRVLLAAEPKLFEVWKSEWRDTVIMIAESSGPKNMADPVFVADFEG